MCSNLSNFNYKPQVESRQQHLALYTEPHLRTVAIMTEVTSHHMEYTHFYPDYSWITVLLTILKSSREQGVLSSGHCSRCSIVCVSVPQLHEGSPVWYPNLIKFALVRPTPDLSRLGVFHVGLGALLPGWILLYLRTLSLLWAGQGSEKVFLISTSLLRLLHMWQLDPSIMIERSMWRLVTFVMTATERRWRSIYKGVGQVLLHL